MTDLRAEDLRAMLAVVGEAHQATDAAQFGDVLMLSLGRIIGCDLISYNEINLVHGATRTYFEPRLVPRPEIEQAFAVLIEQHPLVRDYTATRDPSPRLLSDYISMTELRRLDLYEHVFRPLETNHQLAFSLAVNSTHVIGIGLNRWSRDFSARDVAVLTALQPHLSDAYDHALLRERNATAVATRADVSARLDRLTPREREIATLVAEGLTNRRIARLLFISERTVEKHVANILEKLGVATRVGVATLVLDSM